MSSFSPMTDTNHADQARDVAAFDRDIELPDSARHGIFGFDSRDRRSRPFNLLRSQVLKIAQSQGWKIIGVTSATPGVGKTFVACNLAASLSRIPGKRTALYDLDLRRGSVARQFGLPRVPGLQAYFAEEITSPEQTALHVRDTGLTIYPSYATGVSSAEVLAGARMRALVARMRAIGDEAIVLCDLPPAFANDDASIVLRQIDAYILVIEGGKTTARQVREAIEVLQPAPCLGTVLNRFRGAVGSDDYGFGYWSDRSYSDYYS